MTRKTDYALVALATLAERHDGHGDPLSARQIAERHHLPLPLLMNALKELQRATLITSRRGAGGGYFLAAKPENITIRQVIEALEGPVNVTLCSGGDDHESCELSEQCTISHPMQKLNVLLSQFLGRVTLKNLVEAKTMDGLMIMGAPV